ncbi:hypothetical protein [Rhodococcus qingshengii]
MTTAQDELARESVGSDATVSGEHLSGHRHSCVHAIITLSHLLRRGRRYHRERA